MKLFQFWPFPSIRIGETDAGVTRLFLDFAAAPDLTLVSTDAHTMTLACHLGAITFRTTNAFYAWGHSGIFINAAGGGRSTWGDDILPSRYAVKKMREALETVRFAYVKRPTIEPTPLLQRIK